MSAPSLEKRIATALGGNDATLADLATLIAETEAAITQADATAEAERTKALDPVLSPDAKAAREAMQSAEFSRNRLRTVLPRLQARLAEVQAAEYAARWEPDLREVEAARDALAAELAETYPKVVAQLIDLITRVKTCDAEVGRINGTAPPGERRRLHEVELAARGLDHFTRDDPPIARDLRLPDFERSSRMAWPLPAAIPDFAAMTCASAHDPRNSADWHTVAEEKERRRKQTEAAAELQELETAMARAAAAGGGAGWWLPSEEERLKRLRAAARVSGGVDGARNWAL